MSGSPKRNNKCLQILGIRGIPAQHGGFETFAEYLSLYLVEHGWEVIVYCQEEGGGPIAETVWKGVKLIHIPVKQGGSAGSIIFDWRSVWMALRRNGPVLTLGYNTAILSILLRFKRIKNLMNMDGIEWRRKKWSVRVRAWFYINEILGAYLADHLIADHPEIENHLARLVSRKKITMIPYGADEVNKSDIAHIEKFGLRSKKYAIIVARPEPENSILEIVTAFSRIETDCDLVVLGKYLPDCNSYHKAVMEAVNNRVKFIGAIYDKEVVQSLRFYSRFYVHGHQAGGTNPSLVEALGAGSAILADDNKYNRWVARDGARYFYDKESCQSELAIMFSDDSIIAHLSESSRKHFEKNFKWDGVLEQYERLLDQWC